MFDIPNDLIPNVVPIIGVRKFDGLRGGGADIDISNGKMTTLSAVMSHLAVAGFLKTCRCIGKARNIKHNEPVGTDFQRYHSDGIKRSEPSSCVLIDRRHLEAINLLLCHRPLVLVCILATDNENTATVRRHGRYVFQEFKTFAFMRPVPGSCALEIDAGLFNRRINHFEVASTIHGQCASH